MERNIICDISEPDKMQSVAEALNSKARINLLRLISSGSYSVNELAMLTKTPMSTTSFHLSALKKAGLIKIVSNPHKRGNEKIVSHIVSSIRFEIESKELIKSDTLTIDLPVGSFSSASVVAPCGIADRMGVTFDDDQPGVFFSHHRVNAELIWFSKGYVEYTIPTYALKGQEIESLSFSLELCSECPNYRDDWKSDITFWINSVELCTYLSPGDFGGHRGRLNPPNWSDSATQYGLLKFFKVNQYGTFLDENMCGHAAIDDLNLSANPFFTLRIGVKENAKHVGGVNIFGKSFGNFEQGILINIETKKLS